MLFLEAPRQEKHIINMLEKKNISEKAMLRLLKIKTVTIAKKNKAIRQPSREIDKLNTLYILTMKVRQT